MKNIGITLLGVISSFVLLGQTGTIKGTVTEPLDGKSEPVPFASVYLYGTTTGGITDFDGNYQILAPVGAHQLVVSFTGYEADTLSVNVKEGETTTVNFKVRQKSFSLKAVEVVAKVNRESEAALMMDRKNADAIEEKIGAQELSKKGAGDVQEGLTKMSGVSQAGAGSIMVRGLGDRYNNTYLNGIPLPSPDPDKKVIPLDIIPTSVVKSLTVSKTFMPNQFGDVSGASINIDTKDYPEEKTLEVYGGLGINSQNVGKTMMSYDGGKSDYFGFDDGTRSLPSELNAKWFQLDNPSKNLYNSNDPNKNPAYPGTPFEKNFNPIIKNAPLNSKFGFNAGNFFGKENNKKGFGFLVLGSFENKSHNENGIFRVVNAQDAKLINYTYDASVQSTSTSALGSLYYRFDPDNSIKFNSMFVNLSNNTTRETDGYHWDYDNIGQIFSRRMTWVENKLWSNQLIGSHKMLNNKLSVNWSGAYQVTGSKEPDRRQLIWSHKEGDDRSQYQFHTFDIADQHRYYMYLEENEYNAQASANYILSSNEDGNTKSSITAGYAGRFKKRQQDFRFYSHNFKDFNAVTDLESVDADNPDAYITDANNANGAYWQREESRPESATEGYLTIHSGFVNYDIHFNPKWYLIAGLRVEKSYQEIKYRLQSSPLDPEFVESQVIDTISFLPMASIKFSPNKKSSYRFVGSQTMTRPNFKELAPFQYREFFGGQVRQGNPLLKNSINYNADLRYEIYPKSGDLYSATVFGRYINSPIEQVTIGSASGILLTYQNADYATAYGIELEYLKKLRNVVGAESFLRDFAVGVNFSYILSKVLIDTTSNSGPSATINNPNRPLQGASPILLNADISYEKRFSETYKTSATVSYNFVSKRLYSVGRQNIGDAYELSVQTLNLTWKNEIGQHWQIDLSASNLLNPLIRVEQESTKGNAPTMLNQYKRGMNIGLTVGYKIFTKK